jgi:hypothetical protein
MSERKALEAQAAERLLSGQAWDDFCDTLKAAGRTIEAFGDEPSGLDRAEWYRYMTRLARSSLERLLENYEPTRPRLRDMVWRQSINVQSPDQDHLMCQFDEARDYRITGARAGAPYFVLAALRAPAPANAGAFDWAARGTDGLKDFDPSNLKTTAFLGSQTMRFEPDGRFEVILSQNDPGPTKNWLKLDPDTNCILIRTVFHDRAREAAPSFEIARMDGAGPQPTTPALMAEGLAWAAQGVLGYAELVRNWWQGDRGAFKTRRNRLSYSQAQYLSNGGVPDRHFAFGSWQKFPDEALVVEFRPPECEYWNFQLCNIWQENLDNYEDGQGFVTKFRVKGELDGRVRVVIAERDPGVGGEYLNSYGHVSGLWGLRLIRTPETTPVKVWRLQLGELEAHGLAALDGVTPIETGEFVD